MKLDDVSTDRWIARGARSLALAWQEVARSLDGRWEDRDLAWLADSASPNPFLNGATLKRPLQPAEAEQLTVELESFFGQTPGGPWLLWSSWPTLDLSRLGYVLWGHPPVMLRPAGGEAPTPPSELRIVEARDAATLEAVERVLVEGFPLLGLEGRLPGCLFRAPLLGGRFRFWAGYVDGQPLSVAAALMDEKASHVMFVATRPEARGRGYGAALTWCATLADATRPAMLEASDDGLPVYERMGYRTIARMSLWERPRDMAKPVYSPYAPTP
jgi:ribosomal protein S18 acetylase RimI-like enzyme